MQRLEWDKLLAPVFFREAGGLLVFFREAGGSEALFFCSSQNCSIWPVLKHGPRSLTFVRVDECFKLVGVTKVTAGIFAPATNWLIERGLSMSISVRTRKMVNYAWVGWSQGKLWWRVVAILTCKSFVKPEYRGERLIEPSSSWFLSKFPSG